MQDSFNLFVKQLCDRSLTLNMLFWPTNVCAGGGWAMTMNDFLVLKAAI